MATNPRNEAPNLKRKRSTEGLFQSRIITFVVGPEATVFRVHQDALASLSKPLQVLLTGPMKESIEARVIWDEIDPPTFLDLVEFAYSKNYKSKRFATSLIKTHPYNLAGCYAVQRLLDEFIHNNAAIHGVEIRALFERHINLYILADQYEIQSLLNLVLVKIYNALLFANRSPALVKTTCAMMSLIWNNTLESDPLRKMWLSWIMTDPGLFTGNPAGTGGHSEEFVSALGVGEFAKQYALCVPNSFWRDIYKPL